LTVSPHGFQHCSFVNSINTRLGGTHVAFIANAIASELCAHINGKSGGQKAKKGRTKGGKVTVKPNQVKNHLALWVNAQIHNPAFASQTKESLTTAFKNFGCAPALSPAFFKALKTKACGIVQATVRLAKFKTKKNFTSVARRMTRLRGIKKLDDANNAGTAKSHNCTLILTEGDSAKTLAVSGIAVVGRDNFGVFPLKGKPLNPRDEADSKVRANEELTNIVKIMGIDRKTAYTRETVRKLRYGSIMIMADQDVDGSHIKGLIINFLHWYNPSLLKCSGFLKQFITPLIRATKVSVLFMYRYILRESCSQFDSLPLTSLTIPPTLIRATKGKVIRTFFTAAEFLEWRRAEIEEGHRAGLGGDAGLSKWRIKYYKGLGTSTAKEAKEYFGNLNKHVLGFDPMTVSTAESRQQRQLQLQQQQQEDREQRMEVVGVDGVEGEIVDVVVDAATLVKREDERWAALSDETWIKVRECLVPLSLALSCFCRLPLVPCALPSCFPSCSAFLISIASPSACLWERCVDSEQAKRVAHPIQGGRRQRGDDER
jgi:DNA topoisomerase-2